MSSHESRARPGQRRKVLWLVVAALPVAALALLLFALYTTAGTRLTLKVARPWLPERLAFDSVAGSLAGPLVINGVHYGQSGLEVEVQQLQLRWRPWALLGGRLSIQSLGVVGPTVRIEPYSTGTDVREPSAPPDSMSLASRMSVEADSLWVTGGSIVLPAGWVADSLAIGARGSDARYDVRLTATVKEPHGRWGHLRLVGRGDAASLVADSLALLAPGAKVTGNLRVAWRPVLAWQGQLQCALDHPGLLDSFLSALEGSLQATLDVEGTYDSSELKVRAHLNSLRGTLNGEPVSGEARLSWGVAGMVLDTLQLMWGPLELAAQARILDTLSAGFTLSAPDLSFLPDGGGGSIRASGRAWGDPSAPFIDALLSAERLTWKDAHCKSLSGRVQLSEGGRGPSQLELAATRISWANRSVDSLRLKVSGTRASHRMDFTLRREHGSLLLSTAGRLDSLGWSGEIEDLRLNTALAGTWRLNAPAGLRIASEESVVSPLCLAARDGRLCLEGRWRSASAWNLRAELDEVPLALLEPFMPDSTRWEGSLDGDIALAAAESTVAGHVSLGTTPGYLAVGADSTWLGAARIEAQIGAATTSARARAGVALRSHQALSPLEVALHLPGWDRVRHLLEAPDPWSELGGYPWSCSLTVREFSLQALEPVLPPQSQVSGKLQIESFISVLGRDRARVSVQAAAGPGKIHLPGSADTLRVSWDRDIAASLAFEKPGPRWTGAGEAHAGGARWSRGGFSLSLDSCQVSLRAGDTSLHTRLNAVVSTDVALPGSRWSLGAVLPSLDTLFGARHQAGLVETFRRHAWACSLDVGDTDLRQLGLTLPEDWSILGQVRGEGRLHHEPHKPLTGFLTATVAPGSLLLPGDAESVELLWDETLWRVDVGDTGASGRVQLKLHLPGKEPVATLDFAVDAPDLSSVDALAKATPVTGRLELHVELAMLDYLSSALAESDGTLQIHSALRGTTREVQVDGKLKVQGRTFVRPLGIELSEIDITSESREGRLLLNGTVRSGQGWLQARADWSRWPTDSAPSSIVLYGERFQAANTRELQLWLSPQLELLFTGRQIDVSGRVQIPEAHIQLREVPKSAIRTSRDVVIVDLDTSRTRAPVPLTANLVVTLGDKVSFRGFDATGRLAGQLEVSQAPYEAPRGRGVLTFVEGRYRGYGQDLTIDPGRLIFEGPLDDPALDVLAYRKATDHTKAGFKLTGPASDRQIELYSDPPQNENEIMSYILYGRAMGDASESDQRRASDAAAYLGGNLLAAQAVTQVALIDEAEIEPGTSRNDAAFFAGKYLSPELFVGYGTGIFETMNTLRIRYILSSHITLQAEAGSRETADVVYQIER